MEYLSEEAGKSQLKENRLLGVSPIFKNRSKVIFKGKNNILFCEENVVLDNSQILFEGSNSIVYLSKGKNPYKIHAAIRYNSVLFFGENNYFNQKMVIILSEQKNVFIGDDGLFSYGITIRVADPHLIYSCATKERMNYSKSVYIGDHVWIGQQALILKGTEIGSGSIVGAGAVVAGKKIPSNTSWVGNPARMAASDVFFLKDVVHNYRDENTEKSKHCESEEYIYHYEKDSVLTFEEIENFLESNRDTAIRLEFIKSRIKENKGKNRFFVNKGKA